jgi:thymidine phosphorylase
VLIDLPFGKTAKFDKTTAMSVKHLMEKIGSRFKIKLKCLITDGSQPIGNGIGPILEMNDILSVLKRNEQRPLDLERKSLMLATELLSMIIPESKAQEICKAMLDSGKAYEKFKQIVQEQGENPDENEMAKKLQLGKYRKIIQSYKSGKVIEIDNKKIARITRLLGCPSDKGSGIYLYKHVGDKVHYGEPVLTLYSEDHEKLNYTLNLLKHIMPMEIH